MVQSNINVLVTGGSGFLGKAIVRELLEADAPVKAAMVRVFDLKEAEENMADRRIEFYRGDVRDAEALKTACKGIDLVIHSAAIVDWGVMSDEEVLAVKVTGTENVISAYKHNGIRISRLADQSGEKVQPEIQPVCRGLHLHRVYVHLRKGYERLGLQAKVPPQ